MLIDAENVLSDAQAITADAASTNVLDLKAANAGEGNPLRIRLHVVETFDNLTSLTVSVRTDSVEAMSSVKTWQTRSIVLADLVAGKVFDLGNVPIGSEQYLQLHYDVVGSNPAAGKLTAFLAPFGTQHIAGGEI